MRSYYFRYTNTYIIEEEQQQQEQPEPACLLQGVLIIYLAIF
jgi:hypothetical protein